jgi:hypothetical protein
MMMNLKYLKILMCIWCGSDEHCITTINKSNVDVARKDVNKYSGNEDIAFAAQAPNKITASPAWISGEKASYRPQKEKSILSHWLATIMKCGRKYCPIMLVFHFQLENKY